MNSTCSPETRVCHAALIFAMSFVLVFSGCSSMGFRDGEFRHLGVIQQASKTTRGASVLLEPMKAFGVMGGVMSATASGTYSTNLYIVNTTENKLLSAQTDDPFAVGDCVEVIPSKDTYPSYSYGYGDARVVKSDQCKAVSG